MILFIAPNPHKIKEKEGFLQRVAAIDEFFEGHEKVYFDDLRNDDDKARALIDAKVIYVHSVYNANKILRLYPRFSHKIITDLHGIVPEEETHTDNIEAARIMAATEDFVFKHGRYFVAVTNAMVRHFQAKYRLTKQMHWIVLPIFRQAAAGPRKHQPPKSIHVVYAGGGQSWQNVPLMVRAVNDASLDYTYSILTHSPDAFVGIKKSASSRVEIKTVSTKAISAYYKKASLGFVLRDDNPVNNVACPTKLIEYLASGVVPIVLSERIGDFKELGYSYIKLDDYMNKEISTNDLGKSIEINYEVYDKFLELAHQGKKELTRLFDNISKSDADVLEPLHIELVEEKLAIQTVINQNIRYEYQIEAYKKKVTEYAEAAEYYRRNLLEYSKGLAGKITRLRIRAKGK